MLTGAFLSAPSGRRSRDRPPYPKGAVMEHLNGEAW
jgi:hypothetical protein